mmetsp:Transcript_33417/g.50407  ORF Transcript_33417/g.50407 Transcript_33417/m.50407 type:complete len:123 (+) Transcript_33417:282-650(+)|eukprot:CAMPEP_0178913206 /NCGR_PEP_ID=MMETSP0786-20121207/10712_1 /TAXON_ID=186022 /ORGANISM="Thalassionema frauenfeldii, Strain CCMP 1798" /LENGTH=122 /DNA_ID=CAMNT_0020585919 /DNA_START=258 /DNA_END=626 /DNA_ORIENTATION=+
MTTMMARTPQNHLNVSRYRMPPQPKSKNILISTSRSNLIRQQQEEEPSISLYTHYELSTWDMYERIARHRLYHQNTKKSEKKKGILSQTTSILIPDSTSGKHVVEEELNDDNDDDMIFSLEL